MEIGSSRPVTPRRGALRAPWFGAAVLVMGALTAVGWSAGTASAHAATPSSTPASMVTSHIRQLGTLTSAVTPYPPGEILQKNGKTYTGWEVELTNAVSKLLHLKVKYVTVSETANIPGVQSGRWQLSDGSWTVTAKRLKVVDFVTDLDSGTRFFVSKTSTLEVRSKSDICGLTVAVEKATIEATRAEAYQATCSALRKPKMNVEIYPTEADVVLAVHGGRAQVAWTTALPAVYVVDQHPSEFKLVGGDFTAAPLGIIVTKLYPRLAKAMAAAMNVLIKNGEYHKILNAWGVAGSAIRHSAVRT